MKGDGEAALLGTRQELYQPARGKGMSLSTIILLPASVHMLVENI